MLATPASSGNPVLQMLNRKERASERGTEGRGWSPRMRSDLVAGGAQALAVPTPGVHGAGVLILKGEIDEGFLVQATFAGRGVSPLSRSHVMVPLLHDGPLL